MGEYDLAIFSACTFFFVLGGIWLMNRYNEFVTRHNAKVSAMLKKQREGAEPEPA